MGSRTRPAVFALAALGALALTAAPVAADDAEAWRLLTALRQRLEAASPLTAEFEQTFVAAGFDTGDRDSGRLFVDLPACLRWDYRGDFPNSLLLCGNLAHAWNEGEASGRRQFLAEGEEPGLDLLRLEVGELAKRYTARVAERRDGLVAIELTAGEDRPGDVRQATLWLAEAETGPRSLSYRDVEGNRTRFEFGDYRALDDRKVFSPPPGLEWISD